MDPQQPQPQPASQPVTTPPQYQPAAGAPTSRGVRKGRLTTAIILMGGPGALAIALGILYVILSSGPLGSNSGAAGIFLPIALLLGLLAVIGFPLFIVGLILLILELRRK